jgi:diguanylate cyclase (GGDEF)-like protein
MRRCALARAEGGASRELMTIVCIRLQALLLEHLDREKSRTDLAGLRLRISRCVERFLTAQVSAELESDRRAHDLLCGISANLTSAESDADIASGLATGLARIPGIDVVSIDWLDAEGRRTSAAIVGVDAAVLQAMRDAPLHLAKVPERCGRTGTEPQIVDDGAANVVSAAWGGYCSSQRIRAAAQVSLGRGGRTRASLAMFSRTASFFLRNRRLLEHVALVSRVAFERISNRQRMGQQQSILQSLVDEIDVLIRAQNETEMLQRTCAQLVGSGFCDAAWVVNMSQHAGTQVLAERMRSSCAPRDQLPGNLAPEVMSLVASAWSHDRPEYAQSESASAASRSQLKRGASVVPSRAAAIPVHRGGHAWGLLVILADADNPFVEDVRNLLERVAQLLEHGLREFDYKERMREEHHEQRRLARRDGLTGLFNRVALLEQLPQKLAQACGDQSTLVIGLIDLDDFKPVNDCWGHAAGDRLLREFASRLKDALREDDVVARLGGDEFALVMHAPPDVNGLQSLMTRIGQVADAPFAVAVDRLVHVRFSMGITLFPSDGAEPDMLLRHADEALLELKKHKSLRESFWHVYGGATLSGQAAKDRQAQDLISYGAEAAALMISVRTPVDQIVESFVAQFYASLARRAGPQDILDRLSEAELDHLKERQVQHLRFILSPELTESGHRERAHRIGKTHALVGVELSWMVEAMRFYADNLFSGLRRLRLRPGELGMIEQVLSDRLRVDLEAQIGGMESLQVRWQQYLVGLTVRQPEARASVDALRDAIDGLVTIDGICAAGVGRPDGAGAFVFEVAAGDLATYLDELKTQEVVPRVQGNDDPLSNGPAGRAWKEERMVTNASYATNRTMDPWVTQARSQGFRSSAAVPLRDMHGQLSAILTIYSRHPGMFESSYMRMFLESAAHLISQSLNSVGARASDPSPLSASYRQNMRRHIYEGDVEFHYQPIVDLRAGRVQKMEALARLRMDDGVLRMPCDFLPTLGRAELTRLLTSGLTHALAMLREWDDCGLELDVTLNVPPSLLNDPCCADYVHDALLGAGIDPGRLGLEILEGDDQLSEVQRYAAVRSLARLGATLIMDDLGSGHSSLIRLKNLPFRVVKIDQGLVSEAAKDPLKVIGLLNALIGMGKSLGQAVIIEGLETIDLIEVASILGADGGQGYALARPMPAADVVGWVREFRSDVDVTRPKTALGAIASFWRWGQVTAGVSEALQASGSICPCGLDHFIQARGLGGSRLDIAHHEMHSVMERSGSRKREYETLSKQVLSELRGLV